MGNQARREATQYEIRVEGHLAPQRLKHFEGLEIHHDAGGVTVLSGPIRDQAALNGLLGWLQRLGVTLLLVRQVGNGS